MQLTPREREIAGLIRVGRSTSEIAEALYISPSTVSFHRKNLRRKLGLAPEAHAWPRTSVGVATSGAVPAASRASGSGQPIRRCFDAGPMVRRPWLPLLKRAVTRRVGASVRGRLLLLREQAGDAPRQSLPTPLDCSGAHDPVAVQHRAFHRFARRGRRELPAASPCRHPPGRRVWNLLPSGSLPLGRSFELVEGRRRPATRGWARCPTRTARTRNPARRRPPGGWSQLHGRLRRACSWDPGHAQRTVPASRATAPRVLVGSGTYTNVPAGARTPRCRP